MKRITAKACLLVAAALVLPLQSMAQSFFPSRQGGVQLYTIEGTLADYAVGQKMGNITINTPLGTKQEFYIGYPMKINGKEVSCPLPPLGGAAPDTTICRDWPRDVIVGKSKVKLTYWKVRIGNAEADVSDQIDSLK